MRTVLCDVAVNLIFGDSFEKLKEITDNSIDSCPTDPPYGIRFMGKAWDGKDIERRYVEANTVVERRAKTGMAAAAGKYNRSANANAIFQEWTESWAREIYRVLKPGAYIACFASTRTYHRMACGIEDAGFEIRDQLAWTFGQGFPKSKNLGAGRGTALKPAWEPICLARKPIVVSNLEQNLALYGTGGLNIDACKIPFISDADEAEAKEKNRHAEFESGPTENQILGKFSKARENYEAKGRWPANLMHDGSDEVMEEFEKFGETQSRPHDGHGERLDTQNTGWGFKNMPGGFSDAGSVARFFYCAKTSTSERDAGLEDFATDQQDESRVAGRPGSDNPRNRGAKQRANHHPTVKPLALMRWLCRLITPAGGTAIDPFLGSGSTGVACVHEGLGFVGIEREEPYFRIAQARIAEAQGPLFANLPTE